MSTTNEFVILWTTDEGQEESSGIYFYGLFESTSLPDLHGLIELDWAGENGETKIDTIESQFGVVVVVALKLLSIPEENEWLSKIESSLTTMIDRGARVAWVGGEDCTWSPEVLDPTSGAGNVYAAKTALTKLICNDTFGEPMQFISDDQLSPLWNVVLQAG